MYYKLEGKKVVPAKDVMDWAEWHKSAYRNVARVEMPDGTVISTVFLGLDHGHHGNIQLFETMIFGGEHDGYRSRCATWEEAEEMHLKAIELIFEP
jgi:hypothetical protein